MAIDVRKNQVSAAILAQVLVFWAFCALVVSLDMAKPNQRPGKSHDEVMKSKLSLDAKVAEFRARVAASDMKESAWQ